jgi:hypothetical protein
LYIYDINIIGDFQNVTLDYTKTNLYGVRENCNCIKLGLVSDSNSNMNTDVGGQNNMLSTTQPSQLPQLTDDQKNALFKPYQLTAATTLLNKMSNDSNEIFGHTVVYFLTDPDKKGIDYSFHEYQLYNYVCNEEIKVSVENNQFPDNTGTINQFDLSLFDFLLTADFDPQQQLEHDISICYFTLDKKTTTTTTTTKRVDKETRPRFVLDNQ